MRLTQPLLKLPISFCAETLAAEVRALPKSDWVPHPTGYVGNEAVRLVTPDGQPTDDIEGPMAATSELLRCPYIMEVMAELGGVWGRSRLMGLGPGAEVPRHVDIHYYWRTHLRIHIPVITNPKVNFTCSGETVHMAAGECWVFDSFRGHTVENGGTEQRVHLVLDTVGGTRLWDLIEAAQAGNAETVKFPPGERIADGLLFEHINAPKIMSPWEMRCHLAFLYEHVQPHPKLDMVIKRMDRFVTGWTAAWAEYGTADEGLSTYRDLVLDVRRELNHSGGAGVRLVNNMPLFLFLEELIFKFAVSPRAERLVSPVAGIGEERLAS